MDYVRLGRSGLWVSRICLGMDRFGDPSVKVWAIDQEGAAPLVQHAVELGVNYFDTADVYSLGASEIITGKLTKRFFSRREDYILATKLGLPMRDGPNHRGLSRRHILASIDASLSRLGVDHVDLYQIHRWDPATPIEETMEALDDIVRAGKVRYLGASSMWAWQLAKAQYTADRHGWTRFVSMQNHYNLLYREEEREMIPLLRDQGVAAVPWSPLARGLLARAGRDPGTSTLRSRTDHLIDERYPEVNHDILRAVAEVGRARGLPAAQIALAWLLRQPTVAAAIVGVSDPAHADTAVGALEVDLSDDEVARLTEHYRHQAVVGHD